jgi:hypothetical protein
VDADDLERGRHGLDETNLVAATNDPPVVVRAVALDREDVIARDGDAHVPRGIRVADEEEIDLARSLERATPADGGLARGRYGTEVRGEADLRYDARASVDLLRRCVPEER